MKYWPDSFLSLHQSPILAVVLQGGPGEIEGGIFRGVLGLQALDHLRRTLSGFAEHLDVCIMHRAVVLLQVLGFAHGGIDGEVSHVVINWGGVKTLHRTIEKTYIKKAKSFPFQSAPEMRLHEMGNLDILPQDMSH